MNRIELSLLTNIGPSRATEFGRFCCSKPRKFANWSAEFGKTFYGKLWAPLINILSKYRYTVHQQLHYFLMLSVKWKRKKLTKKTNKKTCKR